MKRHFWAFMAIVCLLAVQNTQGQQMVPAQKISATPAAGAQMTLAQADGIAFRELSFPEALKRAEVEDKLLFVDCFTTWCGPCKRLSKVVFKDSLVADYFNRHFVNLKMDMEKDEGVELRKKYGVHAYPTLLFINSSGEVVYRLVGAEDALELLKKVKLGVESGGLSGLKKRYEAGDRDLAFISGYINALSAANREQEAGQVAADFLQGREQKMLEDEDYFLVFYYYGHDVNSSAFQYVVNHQKEIADKFPRQGASLDRRLLEDWIAGSYAYLKVDESNHCTFDEQGLDAYVAKMKQIPVPELIEGKKLLFVDDSIVRGTQLGETVEFLYSTHAKEVHMRSACPPIMYGCKYLNFTSKSSEDDLLARRIIHELEGLQGDAYLEEYADASTERGQCMLKRICEKLGFASLGFQSLDGLLEAIGLPKEKVCTYCWNGKE